MPVFVSIILLDFMFKHFEENEKRHLECAFCYEFFFHHTENKNKKRLRAQMQPISPCGRCNFQQDESLGTRCSSFPLTKWPAGSFLTAIHRFVWHVESCHAAVTIMMRQENYDFGIVRAIATTALLPAVQ